MYRNNYMSYAERVAARAKSKARNDIKKQEVAAVELKFADVLKIIEDAYNEESVTLYNKIIGQWKAARARVVQFNGDHGTLCLALSGRPYSESNPFGSYKYKRDAGYDEWKAWEDKRSADYSKWGSSKENTLLNYKVWDDPAKFKAFSKGDAQKKVDAEKFKLRQAILKHLMHLQSCTVEGHVIRRGMKGFEGFFRLTTDKGVFIFECFSIWVWGVVVESHARYLSYMKTPEKSLYKEKF